jgi:putative transposase
VRHIKGKFPFSERRACRLVGLGRSSFRYEPRLPDDEPRLLARMEELVRRKPRYGYRRIHDLLFA